MLLWWRDHAKHSCGSRFWGTSDGFALIELLIAALVVAAAASLLVGGLVASNRCFDRRAEQHLLTQLLASQLAFLDDRVSDDAPTTGTYAPPLDGVSWRMERSEAPLVPLVQLTLSTTIDTRAVRVVTYRQRAEH